jgi:RNA polymerase sigma-70 factor, ECF subfamily
MPNASAEQTSPRASDEPDSELVQAARRNPAAFAALYRRYVTPVYRYLYSRVGNSSDAEDLTAQVFAEVLSGLEGYRERGSFAAWLFTIARHKAADHYRHQRLHLPLRELQDGPAGDQSPLARLIEREEMRHLAGLVAELEEGQQELLRLRFAAGLSYGEMAKVVGRSQAGVKMAVHRLLRRLRAKWEAVDE